MWLKGLKGLTFLEGEAVTRRKEETPRKKAKYENLGFAKKDLSLSLSLSLSLALSVLGRKCTCYCKYDKKLG